jgi:hypothetical protein
VYLYFIASQDNKLVKIGVSSSPKRRIESLRFMNAYPIYLYAFVHCGSTMGAYQWEQHCHKRFIKDRDHGEWFRFTDGIRRAAELCVLYTDVINEIIDRNPYFFEDGTITK